MVITMSAGRKKTKVYENLYNALDYCVQYCDSQDDCLECILRDVRIDNNTECPIYVVTELRTAVEKELNDREDDIKWEEIEFNKS